VASALLLKRVTEELAKLGIDGLGKIMAQKSQRRVNFLFENFSSALGEGSQDLDEEGEILQPWFRARGSKANPREVLCAIPDFDGKASESLGWGTDDRKMKVTIFGKDQKVIWSSKDVASCSEVTRRLTELLGPPAPRPPDAGPKKSKILLRRS
jgi:hypothetical protein